MMQLLIYPTGLILNFFGLKVLQTLLRPLLDQLILLNSIKLLRNKLIENLTHCREQNRLLVRHTHTHTSKTINLSLNLS